MKAQKLQKKIIYVTFTVTMMLLFQSCAFGPSMQEDEPIKLAIFFPTSDSSGRYIRLTDGHYNGMMGGTYLRGKGVYKEVSSQGFWVVKGNFLEEITCGPSYSELEVFRANRLVLKGSFCMEWRKLRIVKGEYREYSESMGEGDLKFIYRGDFSYVRNYYRLGYANHPVITGYGEMVFANGLQQEGYFRNAKLYSGTQMDQYGNIVKFEKELPDGYVTNNGKKVDRYIKGVQVGLVADEDELKKAELLAAKLAKKIKHDNELQEAYESRIRQAEATKKSEQRAHSQAMRSAIQSSIIVTSANVSANYRNAKEEALNIYESSSEITGTQKYYDSTEETEKKIATNKVQTVISEDERQQEKIVEPSENMKPTNIPSQPENQCTSIWDVNGDDCKVEGVAICKVNSKDFWFCAGPTQYTQSGEKGLTGLKTNLRYAGCESPREQGDKNLSVKYYLCGEPIRDSQNSYNTVSGLIEESIPRKFLDKRRLYKCQSYNDMTCDIVN